MNSTDVRPALTLIFAALIAALSGCEQETSEDAGTALDTGTPATDAGRAPVELLADLCDNPSVLDRLNPELEASPPYGTLNGAQVMRMLEAPTEGPFYMVNLIRYRERAVYEDGRETDLSGEEANALYAPVEFLTAIGARVVFAGDVGEVVVGAEGAWDQVAIVEYPCPLALFAMTEDPGFVARVVHKNAGVETSIVMVTHLSSSMSPEDLPETPYPPTADDPSFEMIHVMRYRDRAQYDDGVDEPARTGREAMELYLSGGAEAAARVGAYASAVFEVDGVLIGDGRAWDAVHFNFMPSRAGFDALGADSARLALQYHRDAALEESYSLLTYPTISELGTGGGAPPVTEDGTGTLCTTDADCPGGGVDTCLNPDGTGGFCTREGCDGGDCQGPYVCCRDCADAVASFLPFTGSACLPEDARAMLTSAPAACTCD